MIFKGSFCQVGEVKGHQEPCEHTQLSNVMLSLLQSLAQFKRTSDEEKNPASSQVESPGTSKRPQGCAATDPATVRLLKQVFFQQPKQQRDATAPVLQWPGNAAGEATATEKPWPHLGRGLELPPLQQTKRKKPKSFSPQLGSHGRYTSSKALRARRQAEAHVHKPHPTAGWENEANNPHYAPAAEAKATQSLHSQIGRASCRERV